MSTPFKMKGFSGFGNSSPAKQIKPVKGETYPKYVKRAFKQSKDPYGQDVLSKKGFKNLTKKATTGKITKQIAKTGAKNIVSKVASRIAAPGILYDLYKSGQEHSGGKVRKDQKSFMAEAKKKTKSIFKKTDEKVETKTKTRKNIFTGNRTVIETQNVDGVKRKIKTTYNKQGKIIKQVAVKKGGGKIKLKK